MRPFRFGKEAAFIWLIWHKAVIVNECQARIASASICKHVSHVSRTRANQSSIDSRTVFKLGGPGNGLRSSYHELCVVKMGNYDNFNWKHAMFGERILYKLGKVIKIWHLLRSIILWHIWIECNDKMFNHEQRHEFKVNQRIWDELIIYAKATWKWVVEQIKINIFSTVVILQGFD